MFRLVLLAFVLFSVAVGGLAVALVHYWGWKGLIAFPFIVIAAVWIGAIVVRKLFQRFLLGLFSMKSRVLRGATMTIHSVTPVAKPADDWFGRAIESADEDEFDEDEFDEDESDGEFEEDEDDEAELDSAIANGEREKPLEYFDIDLTIAPKDDQIERVWEPGELILTSKKIKSLMELGENESELGTAREVKVWDGSQFGPDDPGKYPGEQRLKVTFAVKPSSTRAWVCYYSEVIGTVELPPWVVAN